MSYWESRQAREMYEAMEDAEQAAREIADIYAKASRELNYKITQIYERYRDKFELDDDEALKLLNQLRNPWDLDELRQRLEGLKGAEKKEILKELESPAYRARIERLENLQSEIDRMMRDVYISCTAESLNLIISISNCHLIVDKIKALQYSMVKT